VRVGACKLTSKTLALQSSCVQMERGVIGVGRGGGGERREGGGQGGRVTFRGDEHAGRQWQREPSVLVCRG